ncbi:MAG: aminoacyl-tRNA hydrolase [Actinomycetota bacterium]|nr:aminoacyl-tRNA hydrolase [Actinomycetota bacterium]
MARDVRVSRSLTIPADEIRLRFSPSGGPGGQHANKVATRVDLTWNIDHSRVLGPRQRQRLRAKLRNRIDSSGNLRLSSDAERSQLRNREAALHRLETTVRHALRREPQRVATKPTRSSQEKRLRAKKRRSDIKKLRRGGPDD